MSDRRRDGGGQHAAGAPARLGPARTTNAMSVDVEDYFQVSAFDKRIERTDWDNHPCRVERNTDAVLQMFADHGVQATFFTLGWIARRYPALVRRIVAGGHELASHGFDHVRVSAQTAVEFGADVRLTKDLLEDIGGVPVVGYRAPSFSICETTPWAFKVLADEGYAYSSSIYPIRHDHYGMPAAPRFAHRPDPSVPFVELPVSTVSVRGRNFPCGGGGYFRLLPYQVSRWAMRRVNRDDGQPCIFYFHPWEIEPGQPRVRGLPAKTRLRHYTNLSRMQARLGTVLTDFSWDRIDQIFPQPSESHDSDDRT